jgi:CRP-like cAMP-binding protein
LALANMLRAAHGQGLSTISTGHHAFMPDAIFERSHLAVAALGAGALFGEMALLNDAPRNASISCWTDCQFLVIDKDDFNRVLKADMVRVKDRKLNFLRSHVPGVKGLPKENLERISYYFTSVTVPLNHTFIEQGDILDGGLYFVWEGSAESYLSDPVTGSFLRRGIMLKGSLFAAVPQNTASTFSVVATSSPCEVLYVKPENRKHLPEIVIRSLREVLEQTISRRSAQCLPLSPMGSVFSALRPMTGKSAALRRAAGAAAQAEAMRPGTTGLSRPRSGKVPRPMSGKIPPMTHSKFNSQTGCVSRPSTTQSAFGSTSSSLPSFAGLFQKVVTEVEYEAFELNPGQLLAQHARKPRRRDRRPRPQHSSLPSL